MTARAAHLRTVQSPNEDVLAIDEMERARPEVVRTVSDLGRYRLVAELARGGMGIVYLALVQGAAGFNKLFVVKELKSHLAEDPSSVQMFLEEARLSARLSHPNVVQTIEAGSDESRPFMAMEFLEGQSLHRVLSRARKRQIALPPAFHLHVAVQMLEGLHYAHTIKDCDGAPLDLVHRDVSPHNVFVTYDGRVVLLDFGIAKTLDSSNETRAGVVKGKVSYMAPEQAMGQAVDLRADLFSAGVMLWEATAGRRMWSRAENDLQILRALMNGEVPRPRDEGADVNPILERIILKATAPKREDRYESAAAMQSDLEAAITTLGLGTYGAREIGRVLGDAFTVERAGLRAVIDEQLRALRRATSGEFARVEMPSLSAFTTPRGTSSNELSALRSRRSSFPPPSTSSPPSVLAVDAPPPAKRLPLALVVAFAAVLTVGAFALGLRRGPDGVGAEPPRVFGALSAPHPSPPPRATEIPDLPPADTKAVPSSPLPAAAALPRARPVRGFPLVVPSPATPHAAAPRDAETAPSAAPPSMATAKARRPIDTSDPYAN